MPTLAPLSRVLPLLAIAGLALACSEPRVIVHDPSWTPPEDVHVEGDRITIDRHINFELDSDVILADSNQLLDHIADTVQHHPEIEALRIVGHTDAAGGPAHNQDLSERRAASVANALRQRGVTIPMNAEGRGESEPVCQEDTEDCHARNRRVEFLIVEPS